jgi:hypothetical protein
MKLVVYHIVEISPTPEGISQGGNLGGLLLRWSDVADLEFWGSDDGEVELRFAHRHPGETYVFLASNKQDAFWAFVENLHRYLPNVSPNLPSMIRNAKPGKPNSMIF